MVGFAFLAIPTGSDYGIGQPAYGLPLNLESVVENAASLTVDQGESETGNPAGSGETETSITRLMEVTDPEEVSKLQTRLKSSYKVQGKQFREIYQDLVGKFKK